MVHRRALQALYVGVPGSKKAARTRLPCPDVKEPETDRIRFDKSLPHDPRRLGRFPGGDRHKELHAIQLKAAVRHLFIDQHLRMLQIEDRVRQSVVLKVITLAYAISLEIALQLS